MSLLDPDPSPTSKNAHMVNVDDIARVLSAEPKGERDESVLAIGPEGSAARIFLTLFSGESGISMISAQTTYGYFELHDVSGILPVEPDEIIFFSETEERVSGMVISQGGACSLFSNVDRAKLSADPASLAPADILAAMQLGLIALNTEA